MEPDVIETEEEYKATLKESERLFELDHSSVARERIESLLNLIEAYEDQYYQIPPPNPVQSFLYYLESRGFLRQ